MKKRFIFLCTAALLVLGGCKKEEEKVGEITFNDIVDKGFTSLTSSSAGDLMSITTDTKFLTLYNVKTSGQIFPFTGSGQTTTYVLLTVFKEGITYQSLNGTLERSGNKISFSGVFEDPETKKTFPFSGKATY